MNIQSRNILLPLAALALGAFIPSCQTKRVEAFGKLAEAGINYCSAVEVLTAPGKPRRVLNHAARQLPVMDLSQNKECDPGIMRAL